MRSIDYTRLSRKALKSPVPRGCNLTVGEKSFYAVVGSPPS